MTTSGASETNRTDPGDLRNSDEIDGVERTRPGERLRIAFLTPVLTVGGAQRVTINIANSLAERGYAVDIVAGHLEGEFVSEIGDAVNAVNLDVPRVPGLGILAGVPHLLSYLESNRPSVLFASRTHTSILAIIACAVSSVDVHLATTEHDPYGWQPKPKDKVAVAIASRIYPLADDVIGVSEGVAESFVSNTRLDSTQTTVLNNPVDISSVQSQASEPVDHEWFTDPAIEPVVSLGRLEPQKSYPTLLEAFTELSESRPRARLVIMGKGSERDRLLSLARTLGIEDRVWFPGYVENPYAYIRRASVFVLSSKAEGLPTVLIEALACGCSIVATDCQYGPREILADGEYGLLVPVGDPTQMAAAIGKAFDDPVPPATCRERAEYFSMDAGGDRYEAYIRDVVDID